MHEVTEKELLNKKKKLVFDIDEEMIYKKTLQTYLAGSQLEAQGLADALLEIDKNILKTVNMDDFVRVLA